METELPNPVLTDDIDQKFLDAAAKADRGEDFPTVVDETVEGQASEKVETEEAEPTAEELADPANKDRPRDPVTGKFLKKKPEQTEGEQPEASTEAVDASKTAPDAQSVSDYEKKKQEKAAREEERKARSWENLNREKEELARRRQEIEQLAQQARQPQQQKPQPREFSSQQLLEAADDFKKAAREAFKRYQDTGDETALDEFNKNDQLAEQAFNNASEFFQVEQQEAQQAQLHKHNQTWVQNMEAEIKAMPDLGKPETPIAVEILDLLKTHGAVFQMLPDGFKQAKEIAQLRLDAKEAPTLREQLAATKAEVARLTSLTQPSAGGVSGAPSNKAKKAEDFTDADFLAAAQRIDAERT